jgi:hypothetical protein
MKWSIPFSPDRLLRLNLRQRHRHAIATVALCLGGSLVAGAQTTNWVAFNDHTPGTTANWATAPNTTTYNMRGISGGNAGTVLSGNLKDFNTGNSVAAVLTSSAVGTPDDFGSSGYPNAGTPAYELFNGKVDLGNSQSMIGIRSSSGSKQILTFSGLDPAKRYVLKGTAVRGNNYAGRWTLVSLQGADGFTDDHTAEVYTLGNYPSAGMTNGQAGYHTGENRANGAVVGWKEIDPGADGTFNVLCEQWTANPLPNGAAPDTGNYGYGFNGIMLAEVETGPPQAPQITVEPVSVTTNESAVVKLTVAATGSGTLTYQWYRNGSAIAGPAGTAASLTITNMNGTSIYPWSVPTDSGPYQVVVSGAANPPATSVVAQVTVNADTNAPRFLWALAETNSAGDVVIRLALSERVANPMSQMTEPLYWSLEPISGPGASINPSTNILVNTNVAFANTNTLEIQLVLEAGVTLDPSTSYKVVFDAASEGPLYDRAQTPNNMAVHEIGVHVRRSHPVALDHVWKYSDVDAAPVGNWRERVYDDSDSAFWKSGPGVFDANRTGCRTTVNVLGTVGTCMVYSNANAPATVTNYYFRTHFDFPAQVPSNVMIIVSGKYDDGGALFLNGVEIQRVGISPTNDLAHGAYHVNRAAVGINAGEALDVAYVFPGSLLRSGDNVLAAFLGQINASSSDVTMGLELSILSTSPLIPAAAQPELKISYGSGQISVGWTPLGGSLLEAPAVIGPWTTNSGALNPHVFTPAPGAGQKFFRVVQ